MSPCHLVILSGCWSKSPPETVFIGHVAPRSGAEQERGLAAQQGILLAVKDANDAEGQVNGRPVAVLHPDAKEDADTAQPIAVRLVTIDRVAGLLGDVGVTPTVGLARVAQQYNVPLVATTSPLAAELVPNGFSVRPGPSAIGKALGSYVKDNLKRTPVVLLTDKRTDKRTTGATELAAAFAEQFPKEKEPVLLTWLIEKPEDLEDRAKETAEMKPGVVVFLGAAADFRKFGAQTKLPPDVPLVWGSLEPEIPAAAAAAGLPNPVYRATPFVPDAGDRAQAFVKKYEETFKKTPSAEAALAYDAASVLFEAMRRAQGFQGAKVREELQKLADYQCLTGPLSFDKDQTARRPIFIIRVEKGKQTLKHRYDP